MITAETLIEKEVCVSRAEARRLIMQCPEWKLKQLIQKREAQKWGRRPRQIKLIQGVMSNMGTGRQIYAGNGHRVLW